MKQLVAGSTAAGALGLLLLTLIVTAVVSSVGIGANPAAPSGRLAEGKVPAAYVPWVNKAGALCPEVSPALIAAQLWAESSFDVTAVSGAGAQGPAQFLPGTWKEWGRDDDGNGTISPTDIGDAVMAQGRLMCDLVGTAARSGYPGGTQNLALAGYNAGWAVVQRYQGIPPYPKTVAYIQEITTKVREFTAPATADGTAAVAVDGVGPGADAVRAALRWIGTPYVYGGGTPAGPSTGFCDGSRGMLGGVCFASTHSGWDCSSLVQHAWWPTVHLPRTAADQLAATRARSIPRGQALQPGDLVFVDHGQGVDHVVMYAGDGKIVEAPSTGKNVRVVPYYTAGVVAVTRPG
jgi:cell wall-associated NlpC family hydrolase